MGRKARADLAQTSRRHGNKSALELYELNRARQVGVFELFIFCSENLVVRGVDWERAPCSPVGFENSRRVFVRRNGSFTVEQHYGPKPVVNS